VLNTPASSPSLLAATIRPRKVAATSVGGWPCNASSAYWKPPVLPRPRMGGRLNGNAMAPLIAAICGRRRAMIAPTLWLFSVRSS
jgi:hypothetical protein